MLWCPLIALALAATPEPPRVRLDLEAGLKCELNATLPGALTQQQLKLASVKDSDAWTLSVRHDAEAIVLRLTNAQSVVRGERRLSFTGDDCAALPRTAALLVRSWIAPQLASAPEQHLEVAKPLLPPRPPPEPPPEVAKRSPSAVGSLDRPPEPPREVAKPVPPERPVGTAPSPELAKATPERPAPNENARPGFARAPERAPESRPPLSVVSSHDAVEVPAPATPVPQAVPIPPAAEFFTSQPVRLAPRTFRSLSVMLAGGGAFGPEDPLALGTLSVEWGFLEPWAVWIDVGLHSVRSRTIQAGRVDVLMQWGELAVRRSLFAHGLDGFHVSLGAQLVRLSASSRGLVENRAEDVLDPAVAAHLDWRLTLWGGFFFLARLTFHARVVPRAFTVDGVAVVTVPGWGLGTEVGVGWNFF